MKDEIFWAEECECEVFHYLLQLSNCCSIYCSTSAPAKSTHRSNFASWGLCLSPEIRPAEEGKIIKKSGKCSCLCSLLWYQLFSSQGGKKSKVQQRKYSSNFRVSLSEKPWCAFPQSFASLMSQGGTDGFFSSLVSFLFAFMCHRVKSCAPLFFVKLAVSHGGMAALGIEEGTQDKKQVQPGGENQEEEITLL